MITVLNKADRVRKEDLAWLVAQVPNPVIASATMRFGLGSILNKIQEVISEVCPERQKYSA
jgi:50S ribosomal subunit-associated GTPase HflX